MVMKKETGKKKKLSGYVQTIPTQKQFEDHKSGIISIGDLDHTDKIEHKTSTTGDYTILKFQLSKKIEGEYVKSNKIKVYDPKLIDNIISYANDNIPVDIIVEETEREYQSIKYLNTQLISIVDNIYKLTESDFPGDELPF